jgi:leucyl/phenylalanyl-tRNA--protein transferase
MDEPELTPRLLLRAYASGIFPMAESQDDPEVFWVDPSRRGILPLDAFHISRSLRRTILSGRFEPRFDSDFAATVQGCAQRPETWINDTIFRLYQDLHAMGHAHSQEIWQDKELVGGVYGVAIGGAFFGESMFSRRTDASKVALAYLVDRLNQTGFTLFDTQFITPHLKSLGGQEIDRHDYLDRLERALQVRANIRHLKEPQTPQGVIQRNTQTS